MGRGSFRPGASAWTDRINKGVWRVFVESSWDNFEEILISTNSKRMGGADMASLAKRVEVLEKRVGSRPGQQPLVPVLAEYSTDLGNGLAGNERIVPVLRRTEELETFLDPLFGEAATQKDGVRWAIAESQKERLKNNLELLQKLEKMKSCLEEGRLSRVEELRPRLAELSRVQVEQREEGDSISTDSLALVQRYNDIIASLTEAFTQADLAITRAEKEAGIVAE